MDKKNTPSPYIIKKKAKEILMMERSSFEYHTLYLNEQQMLEAVKNGDSKLAIHCLHILDTNGIPGILSQNVLRQAKYLFVSHITQLTRAVIQSGVPEDIAYAMSDSYIQIVDTCSMEAQVYNLRELSVIAFCELAIKYKGIPPHSRYIRKAIQYIHSHLSEKISLAILCDVSGLSMSRFCHLFKYEMGMSPMVYIMFRRIETAKIMLTYTDNTISSIGLNLGFYNESHFIKNFKKYTKTTPANYRKNDKKGEKYNSESEM